jgi:hypothetical protein
MTPELAAMAPEIAVDEDVDPVRREEREPREAEADDAPMLMPRAGKKPPPRPQELARAEGRRRCRCRCRTARPSSPSASRRSRGSCA